MNFRTASVCLRALAFAGVSLACGNAFAQARTGPELLTAAEQSFSAVPFGAEGLQPGLSRIDDEACVKWGDCAYQDVDNVRHYYSGCCDPDVVVVKTIEAAEAGARPIAALGIGDARSMPDVLDRVRRFLPEVEVGCRAPQEGDYAAYTCGAVLGEGWIRLLFDGSQRLIQVRVDAYPFT